MATIISLIATDSTFRETFQYIQLVVYIVLLAYYIFYSYVFLNNEVAYMKGRTISWSSRLQRIYIYSILLNLFLTRLVEMLPKIPSFIFAAINAICVVFYILHLFFYLPLIEFHNNTFQISCSISFLICFVLQIISQQVYHIDPAVVVAIAIILSLVLNLIFQKINNERKKKMNEVMNQLSTNEIAFEDAFKNKRSFLMTVRLSFSVGNLYVFSWKPFLSAIELWPDDHDIWIQWIRFSIIYTDQQMKTEQILTEFRNKKFKGLAIKNIKTQIKFIINSRSRYMIKDLKQEVKLIEEDVLNLKNIIIAYWNEISGGSFNSDSTYNISSKLHKSIENVNTQYLRLISLYPNNYTIALKYSEFMQNIVSDPIEGEFWRNRSTHLKTKKQIVTDSTKEYGFELFPFIPRHFPGAENETITENELIKPKKQSSNQINYKMNSKLIDSMQDNEEGNTEFTDESANNENDNMEQSHFRKLGLSARIPFLNRLFVIAIIFFIIAFVLIPFLPPLMVIGKLKHYRDQFVIENSVCDIRTCLMKEAYYMFFHSLRQLNPMLAESFKPYDTEVLNEEIIKLNEKYHNLHNSLGGAIKYDSLAGEFIKSTQIEFLILGNSKNISFIQGLSSMVGAVLNHDDPLGTYYDRPWFQLIFDNMGNMVDSLGKLALFICEDMNDYLDKTMKLISIILYIFLGVEAVMIPIFIFLTVRIRKNWNYIINTINSLPRVAIQKVIEKYSNENSKNNNSENDHNNFKSEFRYKLSFVQMVSSRDTSGGLPIKLINIIFIVVFAISVACAITVIEIMKIGKKDLTNIPFQYYTATDGIYAIHNFITNFLIKGYVDLMNIMVTPPYSFQFGKYSFMTLYAGIGNISQELMNTLDSVVFGTTDAPQKGILYSTKEILDLLLRPNGNPYGDGDTITELNTDMFPHYVGLGFFYETNLVFVEKTMEDMLFNVFIAMTQGFNLNFIFESVKLGTFSIVPFFLDVYVNETNTLFNKSLDDIYSLLFIIAVVIFVVGLLAITWLIVMIINLKKVVQFSLSLLSMVDPSYVHEMQNIMNLFYGQTSGTIQINQMIQRTYNEIESLVPECPLELDSQMKIMFISQKLIDMWELNEEQTIGSHLSLILSFTDETIFDELENATGQKHSKEPKRYNTSIILNASKKVIDVSFTSLIVPKGKGTKLVLMFSNNLITEQKTLNTEELTKKNFEIKNHSIPECFRSKIIVDSDCNSATSHYLIFAAVELMNVSEYASSHSPKETKTFYKTFQDKINEMCDNPNIDAVLLKKIGNIFIIGFNFKRQITNYYNSSQDAFEFIKSINSFSISSNYIIKSSIVSTKSATSILMTKNTLKFDVYTDKIRSLILMLRSASKYEVLFSTKMKDSIPTNLTVDAEEVEILNYNEKSDWGYKMNFN